jgi:RimJ/RimL family protein N-acetyltransferase
LFLRKRFWGRGYSGERAGALITVIFDRLDLEVVTVTVQPENEKSVSAIETYVDRFGGTREGTLRNFHANPDGPSDPTRLSMRSAHTGPHTHTAMGWEWKPERRVRHPVDRARPKRTRHWATSTAGPVSPAPGG